MSKLLALKIAYRFINGKKRNQILSFVTLISMIGIILCIAVLIIIFSVINGFENEVKERLLKIIPHGEIELIDSYNFNWSEIIDKIEKINGIVAATPYIKVNGLIKCNGKLFPIQIHGIDFTKENKINHITSFLQNNISSTFCAGKKQIIISKKIADRLNIQTDDWITLSIPQYDLNQFLIQIKDINLKVSGIISLNSKLENNLVIMYLTDIQFFLNKKNFISGISINIKNVFHIEKLLFKIRKVINGDVYLHSWITKYGYIFKDIQMIRTIMYFAMVLIFIISSFNIIAIINIAVTDRKHDIAILLTIGSPKQFISLIFIYYGLLINLIASILGIIIGIIITIHLSSIIIFIEHILGIQLMFRDIYFIDFLPTKLQFQEIIVISITITLLTLLASLYPTYCIRNKNLTYLLIK